MKIAVVFNVLTVATVLFLAVDGISTGCEHKDDQAEHEKVFACHGRAGT